MFTEEVRSWITGQIRGYYRENASSAIEAFEQALSIDVGNDELEGVTRLFPEDIREMSESPNLMTIARRMVNFGRIEQFMKHLFLILDPHGMDNPPERFHEKEYNPQWTLAHLYKQALKVVGPAFVLSGQDPKNYERHTAYLDHYIRCYNLRNSDGHVYEYLNQEELFEAVRSFLVAYLNLSYKYRSAIKTGYMRRLRRAGFDEKSFAENIINTYNQKEKLGFTYINIKWQQMKDVDKPALGAIDEVIMQSQANQIKLLGEAGSGKTTALERLEYLDALAVDKSDDAPVPILIRLSDICDNSDTIISDKIMDIMGIPHDLYMNFLANNAIKLYLDGYNELLDVSIKRSFAKELDKLIINYPDLKIVITDRAITKTSIPVAANASCFKLYAMDMDNIADFIRGNCADESTGAVMLDKLKTSPDYFNELNTPIKLKHLIHMVTETGKMPDDFVDGYINFLMDREMNEKKDENIEYLRIFLCALALAEQDDYGVLEVERRFAICKEKMGYSTPDTKSCMKLAIDMGFLVQEENRISFCSGEYADYFMMEAMAEGLDSILDE